MDSTDWRSAVSERDKAVYAAAGYGERGGLGTRPAILVVDVTISFTGDRPEPILESIKRFPASSGEDAWRSMEQIALLLAAGRRASVPIFYTTGPNYTALVAGSLGGKNPRFLEGDAAAQSLGNSIPEIIAPVAGDVVIAKDKASAFFATPLVAYLVELGVDTIILAGCTTSGCVRASCVDAFSYNYRVAVVEGCVFDRSETSHRVSLFDMHQKYANVMTLAETLAYLDAPAAGRQ
jgi:Amidases related to nicotinamidase